MAGGGAGSAPATLGGAGAAAPNAMSPLQQAIAKLASDPRFIQQANKLVQPQQGPQAAPWMTRSPQMGAMSPAPGPQVVAGLAPQSNRMTVGQGMPYGLMGPRGGGY